VGVNLFRHSVQLVLSDWRNALRITGLLYLIYAVPSLIFGLFFPVPTDPSQAMAAAAGAAPLALLTGILALIAFVWIAVTWHRYILLGETPAGQLPAFDTNRMLAYAGYSLLVSLIAGIAGFIVGGIVGVLTVMVPFLFVVAMFCAIAAGLIVGYRLSPILPSAALGKTLSFGAAWEATKGASTDIIILAIISALASIIIDIPAWILALAGAPGAFLALLWTLATGWVKLIVGISIITTIYGYYVEKRPLAAG